MITLNYYLILSGVLFCIGLVGILKRRNLIMLFFSTEILLNSANIALVAISKFSANLNGQNFDEAWAKAAADEIVDQNFSQNASSKIYKISKTKISRIR